MWSPTLLFECLKFLKEESNSNNETMHYSSSLRQAVNRVRHLTSMDTGHLVKESRGQQPKAILRERPQRKADIGQKNQAVPYRNQIAMPPNATGHDQAQSPNKGMAVAATTQPTRKP